jgi:hypothetical protein
LHSNKWQQDRTLRPIEEAEFESPTTIDVDAKLVSVGPDPQPKPSPVKSTTNASFTKKQTPKNFSQLSSALSHRHSQVQAHMESTPTSLSAFMKSLVDSKISKKVQNTASSSFVSSNTPVSNIAPVLSHRTKKQTPLKGVS